MAKKITLKTAIKRVKESVEEKGEDYVYSPPLKTLDCKYFYYGRPHCLVGHVLDKEGYDYKEIKPYEGKSVLDLFYEEPEMFTSRAAEFLQVVQQYQDGKLTWGESLKKGLEGIGES